MFNKKLEEELSALRGRVLELDSSAYGAVPRIEAALAQRPTMSQLNARVNVFATALEQQNEKFRHLNEQLANAGKLIESLNARFLELGGILARRKIVDQRTNHTKQRRGRDRRAK